MSRITVHELERRIKAVNDLLPIEMEISGSNPGGGEPWRGCLVERGTGITLSPTIYGRKNMAQLLDTMERVLTRCMSQA